MELEILEQVKRKKMPLTSKVEVDDFTKIAQEHFDFDFKGVNNFFPYEKPSNIPLNFKIGLIIGASGSGKSTLLKEFGTPFEPIWNSDKAIISHFSNEKEAIDKLNAVGLNSVPSWTKPYHVLSTGEKFRADLSRQLKSGAVIDEFTSVVDRSVAKSCSVAINKYITKNNLTNIVFCTCHNDIVEWLCPDWIFDADTGTLYDGRCLRRPTIELSLYETNYSSWQIFKQHHYLTEDINKASKCYLIKWENNIVGFASIITSPNGYVKDSWRFHRLVVLPDYQGMGIGTSIMNALGKMWKEKGLRLFIKTAHVRLGKYLETSSEWVATTHNKQKRTLSEKQHQQENWHNYKLDTKRKCYTYEYVGKDFFEKEHYRIGIKFESEEVNWEDFKFKMDNILELHKNKYLIFVSTEIGKENFADIYGKNKCIRREFLGSKSKYDELIIF